MKGRFNSVALVMGIYAELFLLKIKKTLVYAQFFRSLFLETLLMLNDLVNIIQVRIILKR